MKQSEKKIQKSSHAYWYGLMTEKEVVEFENLLKSDPIAREIAKPLFVLFIALRKEKIEFVREQLQKAKNETAKKRIPFREVAAVLILFLIGASLYLALRPDPTQWPKIAEEYLWADPPLDQIPQKSAIVDPDSSAYFSPETMEMIDYAYNNLQSYNLSAANYAFEQIMEQDIPLTGWGMLMAGFSALYGGEPEQSLKWFENVPDDSPLFAQKLYYSGLAQLELSNPKEAQCLLVELRSNSEYRRKAVGKLLKKLNKRADRDNRCAR